MHHNPKIIYQDKTIFVLDKPAGFPSVIIDGGIDKSVAAWLINNFPNQEKVSSDAGLLNRLDNDTSGLLVAAKKSKYYNILRKNWNDTNTIKRYTALVVGNIPPRGKITTLIAHHPGKKKKMTVVSEDKEAKKLKARYAETEYELIQDLFEYSLISVRIKTGLRHQIRVHLASIGYPIAGDKLYQKIKYQNRDWLDIKRHFLHASFLSLIHPKNGKVIEFNSPVPDDLQAILDLLSQ